MEKSLKYLLNENGIVLKKAYGQNFLTDEVLLDEIVEKAGVKEDDTVIEIGCGAGALTKAISKKAKRVIGYEIDIRLKSVLSQTLFGLNNVEIIYKDIMKEDLSVLEKRIGDKYKIVANLPYYITTPIVMSFMEKANNLTSMVIMVQEEVANRFTAKPNTPDYGAVTVGINLKGSAEKILRVNREKFTPVPNVDSAVVKIDIEENKYSDIDKIAVRDAIRIGFSSRRKMLVNNVMNFCKVKREDAEKILIFSDIPLTARGETLDEKDYIRLSNGIKEIKKGGK